MGWARQTQDPLRFAQMIQTLSDLDLNIVMLDYDKERGYGNYNQIDVWCRGQGNNCSFVLSLVRFMWLSENWKNARVRILLINPVNDEKDQLYEDTYQTLEKLRIDAEVKIINNQIEQRSIYEIMQIESGNSDLVFLGIPEVMEGREFKYVEDVNHLCQNIGTVALVKASSYFSDFTIGRIKEGLGKDKYRLASEKGADAIIRKLKTPEVRYPSQPQLAEALGDLYSHFKHDIDNLQRCFSEIFSFHPKIIEDISNLTERQFKRIFERYKSGVRLKELLDEGFFKSYLEQVNELLRLHRESLLADQKDILSPTLKEYIRDVSNIAEKQPKHLIKKISRDDLKIYRKDAFGIKWRKAIDRVGLTLKRKPLNYRITFRKLLEHYLPYRLNDATYEIIRNWGVISLQYTVKIQKIINSAMDGMLLLLEKERKGELNEQLVTHEIENTRQLFSNLVELNSSSLSALNSLILNKYTYTFQQICNDIIALYSNLRIQPPAPERRQERQRKAILSAAEQWKSNQYLHFESIFLSNQILMCQAVLRKRLIDLQILYDKKFNTDLRHNLETLYNSLNRNRILSGDELEKIKDLFTEEGTLIKSRDKIRELLETMPEKTSADVADTHHLFRRDKIEDYKNSQFDEETRMTVPSAGVVNHLTEHQFSGPLTDSLLKAFDEIMKLKEPLEEVLSFFEPDADDDDPENIKPEVAVSGADEGIKRNKMLKQIERVILDHEKGVRLFDLHIKERITALSDKFTFNSAVNYYRVNKRRIRGLKGVSHG
jgi:hypothetical protein